MSGMLDGAKDELLGRAAEVAVRAAGTRSGSREDVLDFLRMYYRHVPYDDLENRDPLDVYGAAMAHRAFAETRTPDRARVRAYTPTLEDHGWESGHTIVEIVTDDMPFLVDSVTMELARHDVAIHLVIHPQLRVDRDAHGGMTDAAAIGTDTSGAGGRQGGIVESWMHIEIDRQPAAERLRGLEHDLDRVLGDVRRAVEDWKPMCATARGIAAELDEHPPPLPREEVDEGRKLLHWLADHRFTFLGYREYELVRSDEEDALRAVPGSGLGILRTDSADTPESGSFAALSAGLRAKARERKLLVLTKANSRATVHRRAYLDYIGVKRFDADGEVVGERRFLGLFTHEAYTESITRVPVLGRKLTDVLDRAGFPPDSHDGKDLVEILESYPRDELFQTPTDQLLTIALGVLRLQERRRLKLFLRPDEYGRYMSCLVYLPRDRYTTDVRLRIQELLLGAFDGSSIDYSAMVSESVLARLHFVVRGERGRPLPDVDAEALETKLADATRSWSDDLAEAVVHQCGEDRAADLTRRYASAFPEAYKEDFPARTAVADLRRLEELSEPGEVGMNLYEPYGAEPGQRRLKIYRLGPPISLTTVLPLLQCMGLEVVDERPYEIEVPGGAWIYDFGLRYEPTVESNAAAAKELFQDAFTALWLGQAEPDGFNALVLGAGLTWPQVMVLRAYSKYLRQAASTFSQDYIEQSLCSNVSIAKLLVRLFEARFDPRGGLETAGGHDDRDDRGDAVAREIETALDQVASLDQDRILRGYLRMMLATLRTNFFQRPADGGRKPYLSLKFDPRRLPDVPQPRPEAEIFVYSPRTEGVHMRFGAVARGGIRWSDRREDFRTEILGLAKAQMVKNAVIVPVGAKGGFVIKQGRPDRDAAVACYRELMCGMLDLIDNRVGDEVVPPADVVRHDSDDAYLVVAADKGTATFSDIANGIAEEYDYWLGDAFASGGSEGYDHKAMGITARGAWVSVQHHFRELDVDVQRQEFTVAGIGDMSGDVFGNGMLLSPHIKLVAAFDHRHIFLDPDPDPASSFAERDRVYNLGRSSWADYDTSLISAGGGVYARTDKAVPISAQVRQALGIDDAAESLPPYELIRAILRAPVGLLWNGGIGTYVKASTETHADVGDKTNDPVRVDGDELRAAVVGEGGNLGLTQRGRIEYALAGGRVNADFIDNSAGVDTSDHEVNIKILLGGAMRDGDLTRKHRNELLDEMTGEIAQLVLRDNYEQNDVLACARAQAADMLNVHARYLNKLERDDILDRALESLPDKKAIQERRTAGLGLTSPEFCVLLSYTKIKLELDLLDSDLPEDPYLSGELAGYFPEPLRERYRSRMDDHPLAREIIVTRVVNEVVAGSGTTFVFRMNEETGASAPDTARAYVVAREVFDMHSFWQAVEDLDTESSARAALLLEGRKLTERGTRWLLYNRRPPLDIRATIDFFREGVASILPHLPKLLVGSDRVAYESRRDTFLARGVPTELAERTAAMVPAYSTFDLVEIAHAAQRPVQEVAEVYFDLAESLHIASLREKIIALPRDDRWRTMARSALRDDLYAAHASLTRDVLESSEPGESPEQRLRTWVDKNASAVNRTRQTLSEIWESGVFDIATLSVALRAVRTLVRSSTLPED